MFVFQLQLAMRVTKAERVESGHLSRNQPEISDYSGATIGDNFRIEKAASTAAACTFTFDLWYNGAGGRGGVSF